MRVYIFFYFIIIITGKHARSVARKNLNCPEMRMLSVNRVFV